MLQTTGQIGGQITRKTIDFAAGVAAGVALAKGVFNEDLVAQIPVLIGIAATVIGNLAWWKRAQAKVVTINSLEAAGKAHAAATVEAAVRATKKK